MKPHSKVIKQFGEAVNYAIAGSRCEINSSRHLVVGGCKRVLVYQSDEIKLSLCDMIMSISGSDLCIRSYFGQEAEINGNITDIHFENGGKRLV